MYSTVNLTQATSVNGISVTNLTSAIILKNLDLTNNKNLTKIQINNKSYYIENNVFIKNINKFSEIAILYNDLPAINAGLPVNGAITEINNIKVTSTKELSDEIKKYKPGDSVIIKSKFDNQVKEYNIQFADDGKGKPYLGIGLYQTSTKGIKGKVFLILSAVREPGTYYENRFDGDFIEFIYDLLWWMILINISVALVNMLPLGIFDGGKVFYLTILAFTKSEDKAKLAFKLMTWLLLLLLAVMMLFWMFNF